MIEDRMNLVNHNGWILILSKYYKRCETRTTDTEIKTGFLRVIGDNIEDVQEVWNRPTCTYILDDKIIAKAIYPASEMRSIRDLPDGRLAFCEYYLNDELTTEMNELLGKTEKLGHSLKKMTIDEIMLTKLSDWTHPKGYLS